MKKSDVLRILSLGVVALFAFVTLVVSLANLQIRGNGGDDGIDYSALAHSTMTKTIYEHGIRGQIQDINGNILAYDKKTYNIRFYRDPTSDRAQNGEYSKAIWRVIQLVREEGKEIKFPFWLEVDEQGISRFNTGTTDEAVDLKRQQMFRGNFYVNTPPEEELYEKLCYNYMIHEIDEDLPESEKLTLEDKLLVLGIWQDMQMNAFNSVPIKLVSDIKWTTMMKAETQRNQLPGISINVENQRVYPQGTLACHILGYTGLMQKEMQSQIDAFLEKGYQRTDTIGLDGIEQSMEQWLTGNSSRRRGETVVEIDRNGRQIRELSKTEPIDGDTVKLTIDTGLQQVVEAALEDTVNRIRTSQEARLESGSWLEENKEELQRYESLKRDIRFAQNGAIVVLDMKARVLAMASYPNYDPNLFIIGMDDAQRWRMLQDPRNPLYNNAIKAADTPGSVFKMATALAGLAYGKVTPTEVINDRGRFDKFDRVNSPKCWIADGLRYQHQNDQDLELALAHSCNYYFFTVASRLSEKPDTGNGELLYRYAAKLGLTSKTNIDLPNEKKSVVGSQASLYDPSKPINGYDQDTWLPVQVKNVLVKHLKTSGESWGYNYSQERLDKCVKTLMDMAVTTDQGADQEIWLREVRRILLEELNMTQTMVYRASIITEIISRLNEIKWGGAQTTLAAIGQSITLTTPVAMARYVVAIANGGYVYDVQLIDSIISPTGEIVSSFDEPVLVNDLSGEIGEYLPHIRNGMRGVTSDAEGTAANYFPDSWPYKEQIGGKTGTAEKSKIDIESNSWFVAFAPFDEPEIAIVVYVPNGLSGAMSSSATKAIIEYYMGNKETKVQAILPVPNGLAQ